MAFTPSERAKLAHYLGWPAMQGETLRIAIERLEGDPERESLVRGELTRIANIVTLIDELNATTAKAVQVGSLQLRAAYQLGILRSNAYAAVVAMASALGIKPNRNIFQAGFSPDQAEFNPW